MKKCGTCFELKELNNFSKDKTHSDGYASKCKQCRSIYHKKYLLNGGSLVQKKYREKWLVNENVELKRYFDKEYYKKNKQQIINYVKNYRKTNYIYGISHKIRSLINTSLKVKKYSKLSKTQQILGCDYEFFKVYMENKFQNGMSWQNHGEWHIDHIKPMALAKTEQEAINLNHYSNLQPLWAKDNLSKGKKINWFIDKNDPSVPV